MEYIYFKIIYYTELKNSMDLYICAIFNFSVLDNDFRGKKYGNDDKL